MYFSMYSNCVPVKGAQRSIIYDLQRAKFDFIPNDLFNLIERFNGQRIELAYDYYGAETYDVLDEYFEFLVENDYILLFPEKMMLEQFPKLQLQWDFPSIISNAIIDFDKTEIDTGIYYSVLQQLEDLGCYYLQIRFWRYFDVFTFYEKILDFISEMNFQSVQVILPYDSSIDCEKYISIYERNSKVSEVIITHCSSAFFKDLDSCKEQLLPKIVNVQCISDEINDHTFCGVVEPGYFSINESFFSESIEHNTCLNRKIGIDVNGNIKNCPSMDKIFGNICDSKIKDILNIPEYLMYWKITKDQTDICKVCEFRRMCPDCRVYADGQFGKPLKCNYDPFTCEWKN